MMPSKDTVKQLIDWLGAPVTAAATMWLRLIRRLGIRNLPVSLSIFRHLGTFPLTDHYYEPLFNPRHLHRNLDEERELPGLDLNIKEQLEVLSRFHFQDELSIFELTPCSGQFHYHNGSFESGDAEYLYSFVRLFRPKRVFEIGSGHSTLLVHAAIEANKSEEATYACQHVCIEPHPHPWLRELGIELRSERVELLDLTLFERLENDDILFIDSSHIIRPQGDVLTLLLEVLPNLRPGVLVHIHDVFTPRDYRPDWILNDVRFWNEQYLLEALLTFTSAFRVIGAVNYLKHRYPVELSRYCPVIASELNDREPGSFWIVKT